MLLGLYLVRCRALWKWSLQVAGSLLLLAAPLLLGMAFVVETGHRIDRTWRSSFGLFALLGGTILHFVAVVRREGPSV